MEKFSKIIKKLYLPLEIKVQPYMTDHFFDGKTVVPAAESCQLLALNAHINIPDVNCYNICNASFDKFLEIKPGQQIIHALNEMEIYEDGTVISKLQSKIKSEKSGITRTVEHAVLEFGNQSDFQELTYDVASCLDGICFKAAASDIYKYLVPFGPAYQNIIDNIYIASSGAIAYVLAPVWDDPAPSRKALPILKTASQGDTTKLLGSPFAFDAAMHVASVWGQRYYNTTMFPTGFERRIIIKATVPSEKYFIRIIPKKAKSQNYYFDIWIYDSAGSLRETGFGVKFRDVTAGRMKPPEWIYKINEDADMLQNISSQCEELSVVELGTISPFAEKALSQEELRRLEPMKWKRRDSYLGARLACKLLSRKLYERKNSNRECNIPANEIITFRDGIYPACPLPDSTNPFKCSVSHDSRFAIAAASGSRIGIDVEEISGRVLEIGRMYITEKEKDLVNSLEFIEFNKKEAYLMIWSIKEAVTKAIDIGLSESWTLAQVTHLGKNVSTFILDGKEINAYHDIVNDHLFTLVVLK